MKVLVINTYGGSLLLAARAQDMDIIGCYEDTGFGSKIQKLNFPNVDIIERKENWPDQDLSDTTVIAHPPCSAFSCQNSSYFQRGIDSPAFACTKRILNYATKCRAKAIAIESVVGALQGAWDTHQDYADRFGYHVFRILQNGCMFSAQWRQRFWSVFIKKGAPKWGSYTAPATMSWKLTPDWQTVQEVIEGHEDGPAVGNTDVLLERLKKRFRLEAGCTDEDMAWIFEPQDPPHETGGIINVFHKRMFPKDDKWAICQKYVATFSSGMLCYLDPQGLAGVLMGGTWWYTNGRNLSEAGYKRLMGFPESYNFGTNRNAMRTYLSKGVIPAVGEWILLNIKRHLEGHECKGDCKEHCSCSGPTYNIILDPNKVADFRMYKRDWSTAEPLNLPIIRHWDGSKLPPKKDESMLHEIMGYIL